MSQTCPTFAERQTRSQGRVGPFVGLVKPATRARDGPAAHIRAKLRTASTAIGGRYRMRPEKAQRGPDSFMGVWEALGGKGAPRQPSK